MKIVGINIDAQDNGEMRVSITGLFAKGEHLEADDTDRLLALLTEAAGAPPAPPAEQSAEEPAPASRRRRHVNPLGDGETGEKPDPTEAAPTGRRRRAAPAAEADTPAPASTESDSGSRRRRRGAEAADQQPEGSSSQDTADAKTASNLGAEGGRRRRRTVEDAADEKAEAAGDDKITDVDLTRAASNAAAKIGMAPIKKLMEKYEVERVSEIFDAHRKRFLRELAELVKKES